MATYLAIAATSEAVLGLLRNAAVGGEFSGLSFEHYQAPNLQTPMSEGLALYLYRVTVSANRNLPARTGRDGRRYGPPLPLDLHYLAIPFAGDAIKQQRLLGFAVRALEDTPILPSGVLNQHGPEPDVFRPEETVELVYELVSTQDLSEIWKVAQTKEQPAATYVARMVEIESARLVEEAGLVQSRELAVGTR